MNAAEKQNGLVSFKPRMNTKGSVYRLRTETIFMG